MVRELDENLNYIGKSKKVKGMAGSEVERDKTTFVDLNSGEEIEMVTTESQEEAVSSDDIYEIPNMSFGLGFEEKITGDTVSNKPPTLRRNISINDNGVYEVVPLDVVRSNHPEPDMAGRYLRTMESYSDYCNFNYEDNGMASTEDSITFSNFPSDIRSITTIRSVSANKGTAQTKRDYKGFPIFKKVHIQNLGVDDVWIIFDRTQADAGLGVGFCLKSGESKDFEVMFTDIHFHAPTSKAHLNGIVYW